MYPTALPLESTPEPEFPVYQMTMALASNFSPRSTEALANRIVSLLGLLALDIPGASSVIVPEAQGFWRLNQVITYAQALTIVDQVFDALSSASMPDRTFPVRY